MRKPLYKALASHVPGKDPLISHALGPSGPRFNPRHYKFQWQIFTLESPWEGHEFFLHAPRLCNARYFEEIDRLCARDIPALVYALKSPRLDPANPFDLAHPKWQGVEFALAWDLDTDPIVEGGHR